MNYFPQQNLNINNNTNLSENMKIIYSIIGGIQSIVNILASFLDVFYIVSVLKSLLIDNFAYFFY